MSEPLLSERRPYLSLVPSTGWSALRVREVWEFRDLLMSLAGRDLKVRYKQTMLGIIWVVLQPLMAAGIFTIVFGKIAGMDKHNLPYPYFLLTFCGQLAWNMFSNTITRASECLVNNSQLVSKVFFPRLVLPLSTVVSVFVDSMVGLAVLVVLLVCFHLVPGPTILLFPVWILLLLLMGLGFGLLAAAMTVTYRDIKYVLPIAVQMLMFASPVMYPASEAPPKWQWFVAANPLTPLIEGFRYSLLRGSPPPNWFLLALASGMTLVVFVFGLFAFKRMERRFADVI